MGGGEAGQEASVDSVCDLQTGEPPFKKVFTELDGPTLSHYKCS